MIESLKELYKGSATTIKNKEYLSTKAYVEPFVERLKKYTENIICYVKIADQLSYDKEDINFIYNKVLIMGVFPDSYDIISNNIHYHRVMCMAYALDVRSPICKFYTGVVDGDLNFYAFGADCIQIQKIEPEDPIDYSCVETIIKNGLNDNCQIMLDQIQDLYMINSDMKKHLGEWIDFTIKKEYINDAGKVKLSNNMPIESYKALLIDKDSTYYFEDDKIPLLNILKSFTSQLISDDKDLINKYEKTQLINNLLKL